MVETCGKLLGHRGPDSLWGASNRMSHRAKFCEGCVTGGVMKQRPVKWNAGSRGAEIRQLKVLLKDFFPKGKVSSRGA